MLNTEKDWTEYEQNCWRINREIAGNPTNLTGNGTIIWQASTTEIIMDQSFWGMHAGICRAKRYWNQNKRWKIAIELS